MKEIKSKNEISREIYNICNHIIGHILNLRREFHQYPELAFHEEKTSRIITKEINNYKNIEVFENYGNTTAVIGVIKGSLPGNTRAIRADIDALAINERTGLPFSSKNKGCMHACGHDAHIAILLGTANVISQLKEYIQGKIVFVFQPGEEGAAGAKFLIEQGLLQDFGIDEIYGYHVYPELPVRTLGIRPGVLTSNSDKINIVIKLEKNKINKETSINLSVVSSHLILAFQELISREIPPDESAVLTIGKVDIQDKDDNDERHAILQGTVRTLSFKIRKYIEYRMKDIFRNMMHVFKVKGKLHYLKGYPSVENNPKIVQEILELGKQFWGKENVIQLNNPLMMGEDFSFYAQNIPACYCLFGTGGDYDLHNPRFVFNEEILNPAIAWNSFMMLNNSKKI